jgi:hypothetical protein
VPRVIENMQCDTEEISSLSNRLKKGDNEYNDAFSSKNKSQRTSISQAEVNQNCITPYHECTTPINTPIDLKKLEQETQTIEIQDITNVPATKSSPML